MLDLEGRSHVTGGNGCGLGEGLGWARRGTLSNYDLVLGDDKCSCAVAYFFYHPTIDYSDNCVFCQNVKFMSFAFRYINVCRRDNFHAINTDC